MCGQDCGWEACRKPALCHRLPRSSSAPNVDGLPLANRASSGSCELSGGPQSIGTCPWRIGLAPRFSISKGASSFFFGRARPEFFFTERASPRAFLFFCGGGELKFFSGKTIPKSTKFFRPAAPERGRRPSFDLKWRRRLALGGLKLF